MALGDNRGDDRVRWAHCGTPRPTNDRAEDMREETAGMAAKEGYCVKCKAKKQIKDAKDITMKNGRPATQGLCPDCGTKIFKIGKS